MKKFEKTVELIKSKKEQSLKPVLIETVAEYLKTIGGESGIVTARETLPQGRVLFQRETGQMVIKTYKKFRQ
jgi:hypothetical protein